MHDENEYVHDSETNTPNYDVNEADEAALDAMLLRFGADYNRPSDFVPREEMWHEIRHRTAQQPAPRRRSMVGLLAAAAVLLAGGIGIGMEVHSRIVSGEEQVARARIPAPLNASPSSADSPAHVVAVSPESVNAGDSNTRSTASSLLPARRAPGQQNAHGSYANNKAIPESNNAGRSTAYSLATVRHFTAVEALLTTYQTSQHDARADAQMAAWARSLLSQTRLLLDSPAARDPARNKLLQDLELILVQMAQLSPADTPIDRQIIDGSVSHTDVITRLRSAVPAGAATTL